MIDPHFVFVGRDAEAQAYARAVLRYAQDLEDGAADRRPRRNLIVFHGRGGIGKTELIRRLQEWTDGDVTRVAWDGKPLGERRRVTVDVTASTGLDVTVLLHRLRRAVAARKVPTPAFDIGLLEHWLKIAPLEGALSLRPAGLHLGPLEAAPSIDAVAKALLSEAGLKFGVAGISVDLVRKTAALVRDSRERRRVEAECPRLSAVVAEVKRGDDALAEASLGALLDWDLDQLGSGDPLSLVAFVDGFNVETPTDAVALNRLVYETPRVFWVIAGQHALDWAEAPEGVYPFRGPAPWGGLAEQHALGELSSDEVRQAVAAALPMAEDEATDAIAAAVQGYPIALRLAIERAHELMAGGEPVDAAHLGESFPGIVRSVAEGLSGSKRDALNAASLVSAFDVDLLRAALEISEGEATRFVREPVVSRAQEGAFPFAVHEVLRRAVRDAPIAWQGSWGPADWTKAGVLMLDELRRRLDPADGEQQVALIGAAFDIASELGLEVGWLLEAARETPSKARLIAAFRDRGRPRAAWPRAFADCVMAWGPRDPGARADAFRAVADADDTPSDIRSYARRRQAYGLRTLARHAEAAAIFAALLDDNDQADRALLLYQHGLSVVHLGRFGEADRRRQELERFQPRSMVTDSFARRLHGEIRLQHGDLAPAVEATAARAALFEDDGQRVEQWNGLELRTAEARQRALLYGAGAGDFVQSIIERTDGAGAPTLMRSALCSKAICLAGSRSVAAIVEEALALGRDIGEGDPTYHEALAWTFDAAVKGDADAMRRAFERIARSPRAQDGRWIRPMRIWRAVTLGEPAPSFEVDWIDPPVTVIQNWAGLVEARARGGPA